MSLDPYRTPPPRRHPITERRAVWPFVAAVVAAGLYELQAPAGIARAIVVASVGTSIVIGLVWVAIYRFSRR